MPSSPAKLAFVLNTMVMGGIEKSFLDLCWLLPREKYEITVILYEMRGELLKELPPHIKIVTLPLPLEAQYELKNGRLPCLKWCLTRFRLKHALRMIKTRMAWGLGQHDYTFDFPALSAILKATPDIFNHTFDLAIAYYGDDKWAPCVVLDYLRAHKTICWTHSQIPYYQMTKGLQRVYYSRFHYRCACSQATAERINAAVESPDLVKAVPHVLNSERMKKLGDAANVCQRSKNIPVILTVGRLDPQKGIDIAIAVHRKLLDAGVYHHWYVVGNGTSEYENGLIRLIEEHDVTDSFFLEGEKMNPYPYFNRCDIYVQPSRFEGYCLTVAEARAFAKPIVATDFDGAREQLKNGETGLIVPCNENDLTQAVKKIFDAAVLREGFSKNLQKEKVDTMEQVIHMWDRMVQLSKA